MSKRRHSPYKAAAGARYQTAAGALFAGWLRAGYRASLYCLAAAALIVAVGATLIRLRPPDLGAYRADIELWLNRHSGGHPLTVRSARADWRGWAPRLSLLGVALFDHDGEREIIAFDRASVEIAPLVSLWRRQWTLRRLVAVGPRLAVAYLPDGGFAIAGLHMRGAQDGALTEWLLRQKNIVLRDAEIEWTDAKHGQAPMSLSGVTLELRADGERVRAGGFCALPAEYGRALRFAFDATGDLRSSDWSGDFYLRLDAVKPDNWYRQYRPAAFTITGGEADLELWSRWRDARLRSVDGRMAHRGFVVPLRIQTDARIGAQTGAQASPVTAPLRVKELGYRFHARRELGQDGAGGREGQGRQDWRGAALLDTLAMENGAWPLTRLAGEWRAQWDADQWRLRFDPLTLGDAEHTARLRGDIHNHNPEGRPEVDLHIALATNRLNRLYRLVPASDRFRLRQWLQAAVREGRLDSAWFVLRGHPADFPFRRQEGRFQGRAAVRDALFQYAPAWPPLENVDADIKVENAALVATLNDGDMFAAALRSGGAVRVPDLTRRPKPIHTQGAITGRARDLTDFIRSSPLAEHAVLGPLADNLIGGDVFVKADMSLGAARRIDGELVLSDATLSALDGKLRLGRVNGPLRFSRASLAAERLDAELRSGRGQYPVTVRVEGPGDAARRAEDSAARPDPAARLGAVIVEGTAAPEFVIAQLDERLPQARGLSPALRRRLHGETAWRAEIAYLRDESGAVRQHLQLRSDLRGMAIDLPPPLGKSATEEKLLAMEKPLVAGSETRLRIAATRITVAPAADEWRLKVAAPDLVGAVALPKNFDGGDAIKADLERLAWGDYRPERPGDDDDTITLDPATIPALELRVENFGLRGLELGALELVSARAADGLAFKHIRLSKPGLLNIVAQGEWKRASADAQRSGFRAEAQAKTMSHLLQTFGYDASQIKKGETRMTAHVAWPGSPLDFAPANLEGELAIHIKKGRILQVDPAAGRLFGLLSLQTLPRRLSLDFSDLLGKGLAFDSIEADFKLDGGNAYTDNLRLRGPAADVAVSGRAGIGAQDYDQIATVTPQVADNLPVAGALFGPVGIGIGAMLYLAGNIFSPLDHLNESINNMLSYQYTITGTWQQPVIEKIKARDAEDKDRLSRRPDGAPPDRGL